MDRKEQELLNKRILEMKEARLVFVKTLSLNVFVSLSKLVCGFLTSTLSMIADGFHSLLDASSNVIGIIGLTMALKPADADHPYGHRKFEALAAVAISFMMFLACLSVLSGIYNRVILGNADHPVPSVPSYLVMILTIAVNIGVTMYERKKAIALRSQLLKADSEHTLSDVYVSLSVIVALVAAQFHLYYIDLVASLIIVLAIFRAGFGIIMSHLGTLVDAAILDPDCVERLVLEVPGVVSCHKIRSRGMHDHIFLDLHVQVGGHLTVEEGHKIAYAVEDKLKSGFGVIVDVVVHIEEEEEEVQHP